MTEIVIDNLTTGRGGQGHASVDEGDECVPAVFAEVGWGPAAGAFEQGIGIVEGSC